MRRKKNCWSCLTLRCTLSLNLSEVRFTFEKSSEIDATPYAFYIVHASTCELGGLGWEHVSTMNIVQDKESSVGQYHVVLLFLTWEKDSLQKFSFCGKFKNHSNYLHHHLHHSRPMPDSIINIISLVSWCWEEGLRNKPSLQ